MKQGSRLLAEGLVIVASVLLALAADAGWDSREEAARGQEHLAALSRDFDQMSLRVDSSLSATRAATEAAESFLEPILTNAGDLDADSAVQRLRQLLQYEIFSPSTGAHQALVASGDLRLIQNIELKRALGDFFGGFDDVRVSEAALLRTWDFLTQDELYVRLIGFHRLLYGLRIPMK